MFPVELSSTHVKLREYEVSDAPIRFAYFNDREVVDFGFETLGLHRISATAHPNNSASIAIFTQKLGMQYEGTLRECEFGASGTFLDLNVYAVLASDERPRMDARSQA